MEDNINVMEQTEEVGTDLTNCDFNACADDMPLCEENSGLATLVAGAAGLGLAAVGAAVVVKKVSQFGYDVVCKIKKQDPQDQEKPGQFWRRTADENQRRYEKQMERYQKKLEKSQPKAMVVEAPVEEETK